MMNKQIEIADLTLTDRRRILRICEYQYAITQSEEWWSLCDEWQGIVNIASGVSCGGLAITIPGLSEATRTQTKNRGAKS